MAVIEWSGGVGGPVTLPALAPWGRDSVIMSRVFGFDPSVPRSSTRLGVLLVPRRLLVRCAMDVVANHREVGPVAVWPVEAPAVSTAVALAVGGLIAAGRPVGSVPPVTCAGPPPVRKTRPMVCHDVRAEVNGQQLELSVWEICPFDQPAAPALAAS